MQEMLVQWLVTGLGMAAWGIPFFLLLLWIVKKRGEAYLSEKGKNLATKEDFKEIKLRLEETTRATAEIQRSVNDQGWLAQQHWARREAQYLDVIKTCLQYEFATLTLAAHLLHVEKARVKFDESLRDAYLVATKEVHVAFGLADLFIRAGRPQAVAVFFAQEAPKFPDVGELSAADLFQRSQKCAVARIAITNLGREELGSFDASWRGHSSTPR